MTTSQLVRHLSLESIEILRVPTAESHAEEVVCNGTMIVHSRWFNVTPTVGELQKLLPVITTGIKCFLVLLKKN